MTHKPSGDFAEDQLRERLRSAEPPIDAGLRRDLWPRMLERIGEAPRGSQERLWPFAVPWFDWALAGIVGATIAFFPALIPALLYHL